VPFADVRWLPARGSIDRSLEDKLSGRKKIVITATIAVWIGEGNRKGKREKEREQEGEDKKKIGMQRVINQARISCLVEIFSLPPKIQHDLLLEQISLRRILTRVNFIFLTAEYQIFGT